MDTFTPEMLTAQVYNVSVAECPEYFVSDTEFQELEKPSL